MTFLRRRFYGAGVRFSQRGSRARLNLVDPTRLRIDPPNRATDIRFRGLNGPVEATRLTAEGVAQGLEALYNGIAQQGVAIEIYDALFYIDTYICSACNLFNALCNRVRATATLHVIHSNRMQHTMLAFLK
jgi:hypothetical protein